MDYVRYPIATFEMPEVVTDRLKRKWLRDIAELPSKLQYLIDHLTAEQLGTAYREGGWTVAEIVHHLADTHMHFFMRFKLALTEDNPTVSAFDQDKWIALADSHESSLDLSLQLLESMHRRWLLLLDSLTEAQWQRTFYHPKYDKRYTLVEALGVASWHGRHHLAQISHLLVCRNWLPFDNYIFDMDGTLSNPKEGVVNSVKYMLEKMGLSLAEDQMVDFIGPPLRVSLAEKFDLRGEQAQQAIDYFREYYTEKGMFENVLFDGVEEALQSLQKRGKTLFIATSKPTTYARRILEHFHIDHYFEDVVGSELDGSRSDKREIIRYLLDRHPDLAKDDTVMIGDRDYDVKAARECDLASIGVTFGFGSKKELYEARANYFLYAIEELI